MLAMKEPRNASPRQLMLIQRMVGVVPHLTRERDDVASARNGRRRGRSGKALGLRYSDLNAVLGSAPAARMAGDAAARAPRRS